MKEEERIRREGRRRKGSKGKGEGRRAKVEN